MIGQDFLLEKACSNDSVVQALNFASQNAVTSKNILFRKHFEDVLERAANEFVLVTAQPITGDVLCHLAVDFIVDIDFHWKKFVEKLAELNNAFVLMTTDDDDPRLFQQYCWKSGWRSVKVDLSQEEDSVFTIL